MTKNNIEENEMEKQLTPLLTTYYPLANKDTKLLYSPLSLNRQQQQ